eukprot:4204925-Alexandrium_andersonii.AAC.1
MSPIGSSMAPAGPLPLAALSRQPSAAAGPQTGSRTSWGPLCPMVCTLRPCPGMLSGSERCAVS